MFDLKKTREKRAISRLHRSVYPHLSNICGHQLKYSRTEVAKAFVQTNLDESLLQMAFALFCFTIEDVADGAAAESGYERYLNLRREINDLIVELGIATTLNVGSFEPGAEYESYVRNDQGIGSSGGGYDGGGFDGGGDGS